MEFKNASPEFIISEINTNAIISTKSIVYFQYGTMHHILGVITNQRTISFKLQDEKDLIIWSYETKEEAIKEYEYIRSQLNKVIITK